jgi:hypothetical protein
VKPRYCIVVNITAIIGYYCNLLYVGGESIIDLIRLCLLAVD